MYNNNNIITERNNVNKKLLFVTEFMEKISERLRNVIKRLGMTQAEFAESIGTTPATLSRQLNGVHSLDKQAALAVQAVHGVSHAWLLTGEGEMFLPHPASTGSAQRPAPSPQGEGEKEAPVRKVNGLSVHNGNVKEYPDIDDSDQIARTAWYRDLPDVNQWIINAMDELRNDEALEQVKRLLTQLVVRQREDSRLARDVEELIEKMKAEHEADIRKKGEAG